VVFLAYAGADALSDPGAATTRGTLGDRWTTDLTNQAWRMPRRGWRVDPGVLGRRPSV